MQPVPEPVLFLSSLSRRRNRWTGVLLLVLFLAGQRAVWCRIECLGRPVHDMARMHDAPCHTGGSGLSTPTPVAPVVFTTPATAPGLDLAVVVEVLATDDYIAVPGSRAAAADTPPPRTS